jgi:hypothetical protein
VPRPDALRITVDLGFMDPGGNNSLYFRPDTRQVMRIVLFKDFDTRAQKDAEIALLEAFDQAAQVWDQEHPPEAPRE